MRKDMADVFHDRPKAGRRWDRGDKGEKRALQRIDIEDLPQRGPNHRSYKYQNYHSAPISRFLQSKIGEKWDDIYKEIAEVCDIRSYPQREILERVNSGGWLIEHSIQMIDGVPHDSRGKRLLGCGKGSLYIHPEKKTLEVYFSEKSPDRRWKPKPYIKIDDLHQYQFVDGIWYLVEFKPYDGSKPITDILISSVPRNAANIYTPYYWNYFGTNSSCTRQSLIDRYGAAIYPVSKLQCNKKEIKKINAELEKSRKADQK